MGRVRIRQSELGRGYAAEATRAMLEHLASVCGVARSLASVEAENDDPFVCSSA